MDNIIKTQKITMINPRGSLREIAAPLVPELKAQGWKIVVNPKRDYYPELDQESKFHKANQNGEIDDEIERSRILTFEDV